MFLQFSQISLDVVHCSEGPEYLSKQHRDVSFISWKDNVYPLSFFCVRSYSGCMFHGIVLLFAHRAILL